MRPLVRAATPAALAVAALVSLVACHVSFPGNTLVDGVTSTKPVSLVHLNGPGSGDVTITVNTSAHETDVKRTVHYGGSAPAQTAHFTGSTLVLGIGCGNNCSVSYQVTLPATAAVDGSTSSGNITVSDMSSVDVITNSGDIVANRVGGPVTASASSGNVTVTAVTGTVDLHATSGDVVANDLAGPTNRLDTISGNITAALSASSDLTARTTSGDIIVKVPAGTYHVITQAISGAVHINIPTDPNAPHTLDLHVTSGDIEVSQR
jgi:hypothetical protein